jgi:N-hydroxyarylamine O-acetyltransferase
MSKLLYFRDRHKNGFIIPSVETWVQRHFDSHFGGTCYTLNYNLRELLMQLNFACDYVMLGDEHMGILLDLPGERVYVDCGAAAPFFQPVRFESNSLNVSQFGDDKVHIRHAHPESGRYTYVRYTQGKQNGKEWYFNINQKRKFEDFHDIILKSNRAGTTFMTILRCQLWQLNQGRSVSLDSNLLSTTILAS